MGSQQPAPRKRHHFAPLAPKSQHETLEPGTMKLHGIVFDMDGTLCEPQNYMFASMRAAVGIPKHVDILDHIHSLPDQQQRDAFAQIQAIEREAMAEQVPQAGLVGLMEFLDQRGVRKGICTRNFDAPVTHLLSKHMPGHIEAFAPIVTREFRPPKPSPAGILHIAKAWGVVESAEVPGTPVWERLLPLVMVGDSIDDMVAGREAGAMTVLLRSQGKEELEFEECTDVAVDRLDELIKLLEHGLR